jgi:hypothetical protein
MGAGTNGVATSMNVDKWRRVDSADFSGLRRAS